MNYSCETKISIIRMLTLFATKLIIGLKSATKKDPHTINGTQPGNKQNELH